MEVITSLDMNMLLWIQERMKSEFLDKLMVFITRLGDAGFIWVTLTLAFLMIKRYRKLGFIMAVAFILSNILGNLVLKPLFDRSRPCDINDAIEILINRPHGSSFPSGHTITSFASSTAVFFANTRIGIWLVILAVLIGFSRLYLFVHFPTDVLGGTILGILCGFLAYKLSCSI